MITRSLSKIRSMLPRWRTAGLHWLFGRMPSRVKLGVVDASQAAYLRALQEMAIAVNTYLQTSGATYETKLNHFTFSFNKPERPESYVSIPVMLYVTSSPASHPIGCDAEPSVPDPVPSVEAEQAGERGHGDPEATGILPEAGCEEAPKEETTASADAG